MLAAGAPKEKVLEGAAVVVTGVVVAAPKPPKVGTLSDFVAPKVNPELVAPPLGFSSVDFEGASAGLEATAPNVNVDEVLEVVVVEGADDPKENVGAGAVGATAAAVVVVNLLGSEKIF